MATVRKAGAGKTKRSRRLAASPKTSAGAGLRYILRTAREKKFSLSYSPMLATLSGLPEEEAGWLFEVKWDGYRALAFINEGRVELKSRNDKSFNDKFYPLFQELQRWGINTILDGEIAVLNERGMSDFSALQNWRSEADGELVYYVFDILWLNGKDLTMLPLHQRRKVLEALVPDKGMIRLSGNFEETGKAFFEIAAKMGLEGIIAKKRDSLYSPGLRSKEWLKIKTGKRQEMVIGGYTRNENTPKLFSALLVGVYENDQLVYTGKIGTGFNTKTQEELMKQFRRLAVKKAPFSHVPDVNKPSRFRPNPPKAVAVWLKPKLVCEVNYAEMTSDGIMRHPSFVGLRTDKEAKDVKLETIAGEDHPQTGKIIRPPSGGDRKTLLNPKEQTQVKLLNGHELKFSNLSKLYWKKEKISKRDLINYYYQIAPFMLPYLKDRPQTLFRHPHGIDGEAFYQKDVTGKAPAWVKTFLYHSEADARDKHFLVCSNEASLLYMASLGCIEINPWSSTVNKPDHPDWCIIDLDPAETSFAQVIEAARVTKEVLDHLGVPSFCKTSGSTGLHIYIPLGARYTYEQSKEFARVVATMVHREIPSYTSIERLVRNRKGKMYIDFLQNRPQATVAAPYSVRPKPGATVSMPLHWDEVKKGLKMKNFTLRNAVERTRTEGDLFKPVIGKGINLEKLIKKLEIKIKS